MIPGVIPDLQYLISLDKRLSWLKKLSEAGPWTPKEPKTDTMARLLVPTPRNEVSRVFFAPWDRNKWHHSGQGREFVSADQTMPGTRDVEPGTESSWAASDCFQSQFEAVSIVETSCHSNRSTAGCQRNGLRRCGTKCDDSLTHLVNPNLETERARFTNNSTDDAKICKMILPYHYCHVVSCRLMCYVQLMQWRSVERLKVFGVPEGKYKEMRDDFEAAAGVAV